MNAKLLVTIVAIVVAISTVIVFSVTGGDSNGDGVLDAFHLLGTLTCDGCSWETDGASDGVIVELSVNTIGSISMDLHANYGIHHWYLVDGTWYNVVDPSTTLDGETDAMIGDGTFEYEGAVYTKDSAAFQYSCSAAAWDGAAFAADFDVSDDGDSAVVHTSFGPITINFVDGLPSSMTAKYVPKGDNKKIVDVTLAVNSFVTTNTPITMVTALDDSDCEQTTLSTEDARRMQSAKYAHLEGEEKIAAMTQAGIDLDIEQRKLHESFAHLGEAAGDAIQMDRNLRNLKHEEEILQAAIGVYNYVGDIPHATCYVQEGETSHNNGYQLVARGGYQNNAGEKPSGWSDIDSPQHSMICAKGNKCLFAWRGSTVGDNWINNIDFFAVSFEQSAVEGAAKCGTTTDSGFWDSAYNEAFGTECSPLGLDDRDVHRGFFKETKFGIDVKNSADSDVTGKYLNGNNLQGTSMGDVWKSMSAITGCSERYYTGHSLGGAAAAVGHWYFEKAVTSHYKGAAGSGDAVTFAAPQPWRTRAGDGISDDPQCNNKRFYLETWIGDDPVPGLPGLLLSDLNGLYFDHADYAYRMYHSWDCDTSSGWVSKRSCWWGGCVTWGYPTFSVSCHWTNTIDDMGCDSEGGGGINALMHMSAYYINYFHAAVDANRASGVTM